MITHTLYVCETPYKNLANECRIMIETFYPQYHIQLVAQREEASMTIMFNEGLFSIDLTDFSFQFELEGVHELFHTHVSYKTRLKRHIYDALSEHKDYAAPWGMLQGIRPTKLIFKFLRDIVGDSPKWSKELITTYGKQIRERLYTTYRVTEGMANLALEVAFHEMAYIPQKDDQSMSLFFMIPFCPTRCSYCSFPSNCLSDYSLSVDDYIEALIDEFKKTWDHVMTMNQTAEISTVYIGGGTPTSLTVPQLTRLFEGICGTVDISLVKEFTVEAGGPDTITPEKLQVMKRYGVDRVSINPQSMHQETLERIGRHTRSDEIETCMTWAKEAGFERINMDIILGLPGETVTHVKETIERMMPMAPTEVTVHTMSLKRGSRLLEETKGEGLTDKDTIESMVSLSKELLEKEYGMSPYYLYRQKHILGAHENIGYFNGNLPGIYNIEMMEEVRTILAFGAGASSKIVYNDHHLERVENVKNLKVYLSRYREMADRKINALIQRTL